MVVVFSKERRSCGEWLTGGGMPTSFGRNGKRKDTMAWPKKKHLDFMFVPSKEEKTEWSYHRAVMDTVLYVAPMVLAKKMAAAGAVMSMNPPIPPTGITNSSSLNIQPILPTREEEQQQARGPTESFLQVMFPKFTWNSFIARIGILQIIQYLGSLLISGGQSNPSTCALYLLGASWGPSIATGQIHRLIFPMMLHANALHIFFNVFFQSRIGFDIEKEFGTRKLMILYLFCGFFGNLMSVAWDPYKLAVGASTAGFGLVGVWLAEIFLTFHLMGENRWRVFLWLGMMIGAVIVMSTFAPNVDLMGHMAGMLGGFLLTTVMSEMREDQKAWWYDNFKSIVSKVLVLLVAGGLTKVFFLSPHIPIPDCGTLLHPINMY